MCVCVCVCVFQIELSVDCFCSNKMNEVEVQRSVSDGVCKKTGLTQTRCCCCWFAAAVAVVVMAALNRCLRGGTVVGNTGRSVGSKLVVGKEYQLEKY